MAISEDKPSDQKSDTTPLITHDDYYASWWVSDRAKAWREAQAKRQQSAHNGAGVTWN